MEDSIPYGSNEMNLGAEEIIEAMTVRLNLIHFEISNQAPTDPKRNRILLTNRWKSDFSKVFSTIEEAVSALSEKVRSTDLKKQSSLDDEVVVMWEKLTVKGSLEWSCQFDCILSFGPYAGGVRFEDPTSPFYGPLEYAPFYRKLTESGVLEFLSRVRQCFKAWNSGYLFRPSQESVESILLKNTASSEVEGMAHKIISLMQEFPPDEGLDLGPDHGLSNLWEAYCAVELRSQRQDHKAQARIKRIISAHFESLTPGLKVAIGWYYGAVRFDSSLEAQVDADRIVCEIGLIIYKDVLGCEIGRVLNYVKEYKAREKKTMKSRLDEAIRKIYKKN